MSATELAVKMGVSSQQISQYEAAEQAGTMKLQTLERVATALGGAVQYAIVTEQPLERAVEERARYLATREVAAVDHSMALEDQLPARSPGELIERRTREILESPRLWTDRG